MNKCKTKSYLIGLIPGRRKKKYQKVDENNFLMRSRAGPRFFDDET